MLWRADLTAPARARPAPCPAPRQVFFWTHERCRLRMAEGGLDMPAPILTQIFGALQKGIEAFEHCRCEMRERHPTDGLLQRSEGSGSSARQQSLLQHSRAAAPQAAPATAPPPLMQTCATRPSPSPGPRCSPSCCCACSSPCPLPSSTRVGRHGRGGHSPAGRAPAAGCVPPTLTAQRASHRPTCASFPRPPAVNDVALGIVMAAVTVQVRAPKRRCAPTRAWTQPGSRQHVCLPVLVPTAPAPLSPLKRCVSHHPPNPTGVGLLGPERGVPGAGGPLLIWCVLCTGRERPPQLLPLPCCHPTRPLLPPFWTPAAEPTTSRWPAWPTSSTSGCWPPTARGWVGGCSAAAWACTANGLCGKARQRPRPASHPSLPCMPPPTPPPPPHADAHHAGCRCRRDPQRLAARWRQAGRLHRWRGAGAGVRAAGPTYPLPYVPAANYSLQTRPTPILLLHA